MDIHHRYLQEVILPKLSAFAQFLPVSEKRYIIAGKHILVKYYTDAFAQRCAPALSHNEAEKFLSADLTVDVFDASLNKGDSPFSSLEGFASLDQRASRQLNSDGIKGIFFPAEKTLSVYDEKKQQAYLFTDEATQLPRFFVSAPMRTLLHWFFSKEKMFLVHGAALATEGGAVLLTAKGGSGKSTTALAWLLSGMDYLGDDYAVIEPGSQVLVHSIYNSLKVLPETLHHRYFSSLKADISSEGEKSVIFLYPKFSRQVKRTAAVKAIIIPVISRLKETRIIKTTKARAIVALAPTAVLQLPLESAAALQRMKEVVMQTPCYSMEMSSDSMEVVLTIRKFLQAV